MSVSFWNILDGFVQTSELVIDRPKWSSHSRDASIIYRLDYGYLAGASGGDGNEIDVWRRTLPVSHFDAVVCMVDPGKHDPEVKLLLGCSVEDKRIVCTFHETHGAGVILLERKAF
jgi:inorganic pyrophosphatase